MKHKQLVILSVLLMGTAFIACKHEGGEQASSEEHITGIQVADTILYPVDIINLDSTDKWADIRLRRLQRKRMINMLFEAIYQGNVKAFDYYTDESFSPEDIKEMEASGQFERNEVSQLQFEEAWYLDTINNRMTKEVQSVLLAWPVYDTNGAFQAYKAGFVVKFENEGKNETGMAF